MFEQWKNLNFFSPSDRRKEYKVDKAKVNKNYISKYTLHYKLPKINQYEDKINNQLASKTKTSQHPPKIKRQKTIRKQYYHWSEAMKVGKPAVGRDGVEV